MFDRARHRARQADIGNRIMMGTTLSRWTLTYFWVALVALVTAEALVVAGLAYPAAPLLAPWSLVAVHLITIGWLTLLMLGALHQFLPVIAVRPLASEGLALASLLLVGAGLAAMVLGFLTLDGAAVPPILLPAGGLAVLAGLLAAIGNLGWTLRGVHPLPLPGQFIVAAFAFLVITAVVGILFGCAFAIPDMPGWVSDFLTQGLSLHLLSGIGGWFALIAIGVSYKLLPMFMLSDEDRGAVGSGVLVLVAGGLAVSWAGGLATIFIGDQWMPVRTIGEGAVAGGMALYLWDVVRLYRSRHRRVLELNGTTAAASLFMLAVSLVGLIAAAATRTVDTWAPPILVLLLLGWFSLLGLGQLYKIVPFMTWLERYGAKLGRGPVPRVQDLVNERRARPWFIVFGLAAVGEALAAAAAMPIAARAGAAILLLSTLAIVRELVRSRFEAPSGTGLRDRSAELVTPASKWRIPAMSETAYKTLDVRPILKSGGEPFSVIMQTVTALEPGQGLRLLATFEPVPLFKLLGGQGFSQESRQTGPGDWEILFTRVDRGAGKTAPATTIRPAVADEAWNAPTAQLDNRGLMPPEPMVHILEKLEQMGPGEVLEAFNDREPLFLYPELQKRGHAFKTEQLSGYYRLLIRHGATRTQ